MKLHGFKNVWEMVKDLPFGCKVYVLYNTDDMKLYPVFSVGSDIIIWAEPYNLVLEVKYKITKLELKKRIEDYMNGEK